MRRGLVGTLGRLSAGTRHGRRIGSVGRRRESGDSLEEADSGGDEFVGEVVVGVVEYRFVAGVQWSESR